MNEPIHHPVAKALTGLGLYFATVPWGALAQAAAFIYSALLIFEWVWKRLLRPYLIRRGMWSPTSAYLRSDDSDTIPLERDDK